jgi:acyl-CoA dehydrogenase
MKQATGAYLPTLKERGPSVDAERLRQSLADWSAALAAVSDLPSAVRQDVVDALDLARRFNAEVVRPQALLIDQLAHKDPAYVPLELIQQASRWGLFTLWLPSLFGGKGWNFISLFAFLEEVACTCVGVANVIGVHYMGVATLNASWNLKLAERVLGEVCAGERRDEPCLISLALNEPLAGTDASDTALLDHAQLGTQATLQPDGSCVLQGHKSWISNASVSTWHMVVAFEDLARAADTLMIVAVRSDAPGLSVSAQTDKLGQRACTAADLHFAPCRIPAEQVAISRQHTQGLGRPHREIAQTLLDYISSCTRAGVGAFAAGTARGALEAARDMAARQVRPGGRVIEQQWAQSLLADMSQNASLARQAYLESALANGMGGLFRMMFFRPLYWADQLAPMGLWRMAARWILHSPKAARWFQQRFLVEQPREWQRLTSGLASMAKVAASDLAMRNVALALELCGPDALRHEAGLEKRLRDAKVLQLYEGSNQLNRSNLFKCRVRTDESVRVFVRDDRPCPAPSVPAMRWPADGLQAWWDAADALAVATAPAPGHAQSTSTAVPGWLDAMCALGWAALCGDAAWGGQGQGVPTLCRVLEALSASQASAAAAVYASAAAHLAMRASGIEPSRLAGMPDLGSDWLAWPAFHALDEQLWPSVDAQGYLRGQVDLLLGGAHARWAVLPVLPVLAGPQGGLGHTAAPIIPATSSDSTAPAGQGRTASEPVASQPIALALVDLAHPAVMRGSALRALGLPGSGLADVEFGGVPCLILSTQGGAVFAQVSAQLAPARIALHAGLARGSLSTAQQHAATRWQGGGHLLGWPEVQRILSGMHERLAVLQGLLLAAQTQGSPHSPQRQDDLARLAGAAHAALHAGSLACELSSDGLQLMGATAYVASHPQAQRLCDAHHLHGLGGGVAWQRQSWLGQAWLA